MNRTTHLVLIPTFNPGRQLLPTVRQALASWPVVWVIVDGSTDGSASTLRELTDPGLRVITLAVNSGKGAAVLAGAVAALAEGFTHALVMDSDGQHPASQIGEFMATSSAHPAALVLGVPVFGPEAPTIRVQGRKLSQALVHLEILGPGIVDPLFGFRVYPLQPLVDAMRRSRFGRRYDFDPELAVRLFWSGCRTLNVPAACRYLSPREGGVSHFKYFRDNLRMVWLHTRLLTELALWRWIAVYSRRRRSP